MRRRKLFAYSILLAIGIVSSYMILERHVIVPGVLILICGFIFWHLIAASEGDTRFLRSSILFLIIGFLLFTISYIASERDAVSAEEIEGTIYSISTSENKLTIKLRDARACDSDAPIGDVILSYWNDELSDLGSLGIDSGPLGILVGQKLRAYGELARANAADNPGGFDYKLYLKSLGIYYTFKASSIEIYEEVSPRYRHLRMLVTLRERFLDNFGDSIAKGFIKGIIFGDKSEIDEETRELFNSNGTGHILAVSGLHVGFLYSLILFLTRRRKSGWTSGLTILILLLYGEMTLWSASTIRAVLVLSLCILSRYVKRPFDLLSSVSAAGVLILITNPYQLFNASFQLSFMALLGIAFLAPPLGKILGNGFASMISIQIAIIPISAYLFNRMNLLSIFINIPVIALSSIIVPFYMILLIVFAATGIVPSIGVIISEGLYEMMMDLNIGLSCDGMFSRLALSWEPGWMILFYGLIFLSSSEWFRIKLIRREWRVMLSAGVFVSIFSLVILFGTYNQFLRDEIVFVSVGQGSCIHLRTPAGRNILIDGGGREDYNVGKKILQPYLLKNGCLEVDLAIATHLDTDHYKGLYELNELGMVKRIITNQDGYSAGDVIYEEEGRFRILVLSPLTEQEAGSFRAGMNMDPANISQEDSNEKSLVLRIDYGMTSLLATGDIGKETEEEIVSYWKHRDISQGPMRVSDVVNVDILDVPHHGSKNSSSEILIQRASPEVAIIQAGRNNRYGHPADETLAKYQEHDIEIYRNDLQGAIGIRLDKKTMLQCIHVLQEVYR